MIPLPFPQPAVKAAPASPARVGPEPSGLQGSSSKNARPFSAVMAQQEDARSPTGPQDESENAAASDLPRDEALGEDTEESSAAVDTAEDDQQDAASNDLDTEDTLAQIVDAFVLEDAVDSPPDAMAFAAAAADGAEKTALQTIEQAALARSAKTATVAQMRIEGWMPPATGQPAAVASAATTVDSGLKADNMMDEIVAKAVDQVPPQGRGRQVDIPALAADAAKTAVAVTQKAMATQSRPDGPEAAVDSVGDAALELGSEKRARRQLLASEIPATPTAADAAGKTNIPPTPPPAVALAALQNAQTQSQPLAETEKPLEPLVGLAASERSVVSGQTQTATAAPVTAGAETARQVAGQIAVAINAQAGKPTEIALNPRELGRVRLTMSAIDQSITLTVVADRPETTDLMRRHIDALAQEFRALGYNNISFAFGTSGGDGAAPTDHDTSDSQGANNGKSDPNDTDLPVRQLVTQQAGLDLRL